jgi:hypothetical protein
LIKNPKIYISAIIALLVFSPHISWLVQNDFMPLKYGYNSGGDEKRHKFYFLAFNYILNVAGFVVLISILSKKLPKFSNLKSNLISYFVFANLIILSCIMLIFDLSGKSRFLQIFSPIMPLFAIILVKPNFTIKQIKVFSILTLASITIAHIVECFKSEKKNKLENQDFKTMASKIEEGWKIECGEKPIKYFVSKNSYMLAGIWFFLKDKPHFVPHHFQNTPYLNEEDYTKEGGVIIYNEFKKDLILNEEEDKGVKKVVLKSYHFKRKQIENNFLIGYKCPSKI